MESRDKKSESKPFVFDVEAMLARAEEDARAEGFESLAAREAHERDVAEAVATAERNLATERRRKKILASVGDRITDEMHTAIATGSPMRDEEATRVLAKWIASSYPAIILAGGTGAGKTVAAVRLACELTCSVQFIKAARVGAHFERWSSDREDKIAPLGLGVDVLIVDDLGMESLDDRRSLPALEEICDARQSARTRTIFTTNLTAEQYGARYSERMRSRLFQSAGVLTTVRTRDLRRAR